MSKFKILGMLAFGFALSSATYAGGNSSPGKKSPTIENVAYAATQVTFMEAIALKEVMLNEMVVEVPAESYVEIKAPVVFVAPRRISSADVGRWRSREIHYCNYSGKLQSGHKQIKRWKDIHRK